MRDYAASTHLVCQTLNRKIPQSCGRSLRRSWKLPWISAYTAWALCSTVRRKRSLWMSSWRVSVHSTQAQTYEFEDKEMQERIIELVIAGTKCLTLQEVLNEGRKHEAAVLGTIQLHGLSEQKIDYTNTNKRCGNYGLIHKYRQRPAFRDTCKARGNKGHWLKLCRQPNTSDERDTGRKKQRNYRGHREHAVEERDDTPGSTDSDEFTETFHNLTVSSKCLHAVSTRIEAFTTI